MNRYLEQAPGVQPVYYERNWWRLSEQAGDGRVRYVVRTAWEQRRLQSSNDRLLHFGALLNAQLWVHAFEVLLRSGPRVLPLADEPQGALASCEGHCFGAELR